MLRGRTNYSIEALNMLYQIQYSLSPRLTHQLLWSRFVNTRGIPGHNFACDLHMEHLKGLVKDALRWQKGKQQKVAITKIRKAVGTVYPILKQFDSSLGVVSPSGSHGQVTLKKI